MTCWTKPPTCRDELRRGREGTPASSIGAEELTSVVMGQGLVVLADKGREEVEV
jgi:hypothetical protein